MPKLAQAFAIAEMVQRWLTPYCDHVEIAGSIRRGKAEPKDVELVVIAQDAFYDITDRLAGLSHNVPLPAEALSHTITQARYGSAQTTRWGEKYRGLLIDGVKVEIFTATADTWGYQFWLRTGPGDANQYIMQQRIARGWNWQPRNGKIIDPRNDEPIPVTNERIMFGLIGIPYIEPHLRGLPAYRKALGISTQSKPRQFEMPTFTTPPKPEPVKPVAPIAAPVSNIEPPPPFTAWDDFDWRRAVHLWSVRVWGIEHHHFGESYYKAYLRYRQLDYMKNKPQGEKGDFVDAWMHVSFLRKYIAADIRQQIEHLIDNHPTQRSA